MRCPELQFFFVSQQLFGRWMIGGRTGSSGSGKECGTRELRSTLRVSSYFGDNATGMKSLPTRDWSGTGIMEDSVNRESWVHVDRDLRHRVRSNTNEQQLILNGQEVFGTRKGCRFLATFLTGNCTVKTLGLRSVGMGSEAVKCLMDGLLGNSTLEVLDLSENPLVDEGIGYVAEMLSSNGTLKNLDISRTGSSLKGAKLISSALKRNSSLERFCFGVNATGGDWMESLLTPLSQNEDAAISSDNPKNITLKELSLDDVTVENFSGESVARMIRTNKTLSTLSLCRASLPARDWIEQIIRPLKENHTLESVDLSSCKGLTGKEVYDAVMEVVQFSNTALKEIDLCGTDMEGQAGQVIEELRVNKEYRGRLRDQNQVKSISGRVVLCGYQFAGKTTIVKTMENIFQKNPSIHVKMSWKKFLRSIPGLRQFLWGEDDHRELMSRTRGFDVVVLRESQNPHRLSLWDFAGQREYYALHDYLFPDVKNSCFLYVCSCRHPPIHRNHKGDVKDKGSMREEFVYWLRFIASNSKENPIQVGDNQRKQLPRVMFVLTNKDTLDKQRLNLSKQWAEVVVSELKEQFAEVISLCQNVEVVNAHNPDDVKRLIDLVDVNLTDIMKHQTEYAICEPVRLALENWSMEHKSEPFIPLEKFQDVCEDHFRVGSVTSLQSNEDREAVLAYLNDVGDVIFTKELGVIIVNPKWFGVGVLGSLIDAFGQAGHIPQPQSKKWSSIWGWGGRKIWPWKLDHDHGFVTRRNIDSLLDHSLQMMHLGRTDSISCTKLVKLMIQLEMCFEETPGSKDSRLFVPALYDDEPETAANGRRKLTWTLDRSVHDSIQYFGRRLECKNKQLTFLTPGFFPRLQVHLRNYIHERNWANNRSFGVDRNLIRFAEDGMEIIVEYSGRIDYFVDILVKSAKPSDETLSFVEKHVIRIILQFCASPQGCPGTHLVQAVIRPICVQELLLCVDRKPQAVLDSVLRDHVKETQGYRHTWSTSIDGEWVSDTDFALDLLYGDGSYMKLLGANQLNQEADFSRRDLLGTHSSLQHLQDLPKLFYPTIEDVGKLRRLETHMNLAKMIPIKLHLMCDHKDGSHKVEGQPGRLMKLNSKDSGNNLPIIKFAVNLVWTAVSIGASSGGAPLNSTQLIDKWIQKLFNVPEMPITAEELREMMYPGMVPRPLSEQEILKALEKYMRIDPHTQWLKSFLNLQDGDKFLQDFQLRKVTYTDGIHENKIGWLCEGHYHSGLKQRIFQSLPH